MSTQESTTTFRINDLWTESMKRIMAVNDKFENRLKGIRSAASGSLDGIKSNLQKFKVQNMDAISDILGEVPGGDRAAALISNPYVAAGAAVVGAGVAIKKATDYAEEWEAKMAEVNVTAQLGKKELKALSDQLLKTGGNNVALLDQAPETFNNILSAGLTVDQSIKALQPTLRAGKAGFADMATTAAAGVGVMNSSGESINRVYDVLFATVDKGSASFNDIAQYLPKIIPAARNAGFALDETAGAWAYLTAQGATAERATTLMENATKALSNPDRINAFNKMGVAIFNQNGKILPLTKIVDQLTVKMDGLTDKQRIAKLAALGLDMEAAGAFASMSQNADRFREIVNGTIDSVGAADAAYQNAAQSGDSWAIVNNKFLVIWEKFGEKFLPMLSATGDKVLAIIERIDQLNERSIVFRDLISTIGNILSITLKIGTAGFMLLINIYDQTIGRIMNMITAQDQAGNAFESYYFKIRPYVVWMGEMFMKLAKLMSQIMTFDITGAIDSIKNWEISDIEKIKKDQTKAVRNQVFSNILDVEFPDKLTPKAKPKGLSGLDFDPIDGGKNKKGSGGGVSGSGGTRTVNITIQNLLPGMTVNATNIQGAAQDIGRIIQEELLKMISDTSLAVE
ncbi:phage tail tape measure protein [Sphingobacterium spiritivorum]|uniref:phage tail tape measure protein n=1 Tax=Sphingobacterium spiritivorum TaxID=258 RepID=UPI003DA56B62